MGVYNISWPIIGQYNNILFDNQKIHNSIVEDPMLLFSSWTYSILWFNLWTFLSYSFQKNHKDSTNDNGLKMKMYCQPFLIKWYKPAWYSYWENYKNFEQIIKTMNLLSTYNFSTICKYSFILVLCIYLVISYNYYYMVIFYDLLDVVLHNKLRFIFDSVLT